MPSASVTVTGSAGAVVSSTATTPFEARHAVEGPVWIAPGQQRDTILLHLGHGRTAGGRVAQGVGFSAAPLLGLLERRGTGSAGLLPLLREAIAHADSIGDYVSRQLFVKILDSEEEHVDWLETQLDLIGRIGEPNYLLSKLED